MTMLRRTLSELVFYPEHAPRTASALYTRTHHQLVYDEDRPCVVCGVRRSTLATANPLGSGTSLGVWTFNAPVSHGKNTSVNNGTPFDGANGTKPPGRKLPPPPAVPNPPPATPPPP